MKGRTSCLVEDKVWVEKRAFFPIFQFLEISRVLTPQFLKISRVLPPRRIFRNPDFYYISSDSAMNCPEFGRILFIISIGT